MEVGGVPQHQSSSMGGPFKVEFYTEEDTTDERSTTTSNSSDTLHMSNVTEMVTHINTNSKAPETITDLVYTRTRPELVDVRMILSNRSLVRSLLRGWAVELDQYDTLRDLIEAERCVQEATQAILRMTKPVDVDAALDQNLVRTVIKIPVDSSFDRAVIEEPPLPPPPPINLVEQGLDQQQQREEDSYISEELRPQFMTKVGNEEHHGYDRLEV